MSILQYFFEKKWDIDGNLEDNSYLFEGTKIQKAGEQYLNHMGQYPVINLSLKSAKQPDFDLAYSCIMGEISKEFVRHIEVLNDENMLESAKIKYKRIYNL